MNLMSLLARLSLDSSEYQKGLADSQTQAEGAGAKIGKAFGALGQAVAAASAVAAAAVGKLTYDAINSYGNYEQLIGGVETLFKDSADIVSEYADNAYKTAGISANQYMETVTSFSASLLQSLDGDTAKAAEYADLAITDMSDNANKMGSSMESIQFAYQGFAKQNYTMLDNLKLGYGGTKTEMERLIQDAEQLDASFTASRDSNGELAMSYADIVDAIHIVQTNMGITGTTAKEAATTIEGSVNSMKASWKNLVTGLGNTDADLSGLVDNFTNSLETAFGNIVPVAEQALSSMGEALPRLVSNLLPKLTQAVNNLLPNLIQTVGDLVTSIGNSLPQITSGLVKLLPELLQSVFSNIGTIAGNLLPSLAESLGTVLMNLPSLMVGAVGGIVEGIGNLFTGVGDAINNAISERFGDAEVFKNTFATLDTNFEYATKEAVNNLKSAWANIIGDTDWQEAFSSLSLAQDMLEKVYSEYDTFKTTVAQWSPEAVQANFDIIAGKVTSYVDQISSLTDENGNILALENGSLAETLVKQVNDLLGEEVLSIDKKTVVQAIIEQIKAANESGQDVYEVVTKFLDETFPELKTGIDYDTLTQLSIEYNTNPQTESPEDFLKKRLKELGWKDADIEVICNLLATDGEVKEAWFGTTNGAFAEAIREKAGIPESVDMKAAVDLIITETQNGSQVDEATIGALVDKLNELNPDVDWQKVIELTVNGLDDVNEALESTEKLMQIDFARKIQNAAEDRALQLRTEFSTTSTEAQKALDEFNEAIDSNNQKNARTWLSALIGHRDAVTAIGASAEDAFNEWLLAEYNAEQAAAGLPQAMSMDEVDEDFIASWDGMKNAMIGFADESDGYDTLVSKIFQSILDTSDGVADNMNGLVSDVAEYMTLFAKNAESWNDITEGLGIAGEKLTSMQQLVADYAVAYEQGLVNEDTMAAWITNLDYADGLVEAFGGNVYNLADFLLALIENENLTKDATENMGTSMEEAGSSASAMSDGVDAAIQNVADSADSAGEAGKSVKEAMLDELKKAEMESSKVGTVVSSNFSGSMLAGQPTAVERATNFIHASMNAMTIAVNAKQSEVEGAVADLETGMETEIDPVKDAMTDAGDTSASNLDESFGAWATTVEQTVTKMYNLFQNILGHALPNDMTVWGSTIGSNFNSGFGGTVGSARSTAVAIASAVISAVSGLYGSMYGAGDNAGAGFYNGLSAWGWAISSRAWSIANSVIQATNAALHNASPSKAMRQAGSFAGEGLLIGLSEWEQPVKEEAEDIANGILGAFDGDYSSDLGLGDVQNSITASVQSSNNQQTLMYNLLLEYLPQLANMQVVIDGDKEVGALMPKIDRELSRSETMLERGSVIYA